MKRLDVNNCKEYNLEVIFSSDAVDEIYGETNANSIDAWPANIKLWGGFEWR